MKEFIAGAWAWLKAPFGEQAGIPKGVIIVLVVAIALYIFAAATC